MESASMRLFAYHENVESVAALMDALARRIEVHAFRVVNPTWYVRARRPLQGGFYWDAVAHAEHQRLALVPGLRRFPGASRFLLERSYRSAVRSHGPPDVVLIDSPYLEPLSRTIDRPLIYVAADAYRFYDWPEDQTREYEQRIFERARASFAVSEPLVEDFRARGATAVFQSPTAVGAEFAEAAQQKTPTPLDLAGIPHPRVGVVGKINSTYDWGLIESLAEARRDVSFVFIGPTRELDPNEEARIVRAFARPNVFDLGARPHSVLPSYLNACDVLLNPLSVTDHNDRRFPLRLSEYLTTDRPVLTTSIHEARWFGPHVASFGDPTEAVAALDAALRGEIVVDVEGRRRWLEQNTWEARASNLLAALESVGLTGAHSSNPC